HQRALYVRHAVLGVRRRARLRPRVATGAFGVVALVDRAAVRGRAGGRARAMRVPGAEVVADLVRDDADVVGRGRARELEHLEDAVVAGGARAVAAIAAAADVLRRAVV